MVIRSKQKLSFLAATLYWLLGGLQSVWADVPSSADPALLGAIKNLDEATRLDIDPSEISKCSNVADSRCRYLTSRKRSDLISLTVGRMNSALTVFFDACSDEKNRLRELDKDKKEAVKEIFEAAANVLVPFIGGQAFKALTKIPRHASQRAYWVGVAALSIRGDELMMSVVNEAASKTKKFMSESVGSAFTDSDKAGENFINSLKTSYRASVDQLMIHLSGMSDTEIVYIWESLAPKYTSSKYYGMAIRGLVDRYLENIATIGGHRSLPADPKAMTVNTVPKERLPYSPGGFVDSVLYVYNVKYNGYSRLVYAWKVFDTIPYLLYDRPVPVDLISLAKAKMKLLNLEGLEVDYEKQIKGGIPELRFFPTK